MRFQRLLCLLGFALFVTGLSAQAEPAKMVSFQCMSLDYNDKDPRQESRITQSCLRPEGENVVAIHAKIPVTYTKDGFLWFDKDENAGDMHLYFDLVKKTIRRESYAENRNKERLEEHRFDTPPLRNNYEVGPERGRKYGLHAVYKGEKGKLLTARCKVEFHNNLICPNGTKPLPYNASPNDPILAELARQYSGSSRAAQQGHSDMPPWARPDYQPGSATYESPRPSGHVQAQPYQPRHSVSTRGIQ